MSKKIFHINDYPTIKNRPDHNHNNMLALKSRHLRVGLPFIGVMILSLLLLMSFDVSAASLPSTQEHLSANKAQPPLPSDGTYFDSPITTYATFPGPVKVAIGGKSLYEKGYRINEISDDFTVTLQACGNGENPEIVAAYLQWYQRWRGNSNTTQFDSTINVKINDSPFKNNLEIDSEKGQKWARIQEKDGGQDRTWIRRNALLELDILQSEWQSGDNTIAFSGLMPPGVGSGVENNETYGIGIHVFYECQDFPDVLTTFSTGLDWFYYFNVKDYADAYSDLSCFTFPPAPSITNVTIDALLGGQAELGPNNLRGSVIKYRTGNDSDGFPQENPVKPTGNAVYNHSSAVQIGVAEGDTAIWKSNLGREWDAYSNQQSGHDIVVQANDTWLCFQAKSTPVKTDGQGNLIEGGSDRGISGDLFSIAFTIPVTQSVIITDWGDLPDSIAGSVDYNTDSTGIAGPSHPIIPELQLGQTIDAELDGQPSAEANGDDNNPSTPDDEDGVITPIPQAGQANVFTVTVSNTTGQNAFVHGFVDWNADGDFDDENEQTTETIPAGSTDATVTLSFTPAEIDKNVNFGARFRLSTDATLGADGPATNGEVEDYILIYLPEPVEPPTDWGDLPDTTPGFGRENYNTDKDGPVEGPSHPIIPELQLGQTIDAELDGQPSAGANGDDNNPTTPDDEDGVITPIPQAGQANVFTVTVSNTTGQNAFVHGFVDWNADGDFDDENEQTTETIPAGSTDGTVTLSFNPAEIDKNVNFGARFRLSTDAALGPDGPATNGEVEDYILIYQTEPPADWSDLPDSITGSIDYNTDSTGIAGPSHPIIPELQLGQTIDAELNGQPTAGANGDDNTPSTIDDEDGVVLTTLLQAGQINEFLARVSNTTGQDAFLYGFIDWNADGDFDDANEAIREIVPTGSVNNPVSLAFTPAAIAENINFGARFRLSTDANLGPDGPATNGEVEDYILIYKTEPPADWGDLPDKTPGVGIENYNTDKDGPVEGPSHPIISELQIGDRNDPELDGQQSATADGDDLNGDDEDGVDLPDPIKLQINQPNPFTVTVSNSTGQDAYLYGFVDWDGNGQFLGETERISTTISTGSFNEIVGLSLSPTTLISGTNIGIRFRLSTDANLGPDGPATNGEVEDYILKFVDPPVAQPWDRGDLPESLYTTLVNPTGVISGDLVGPSHLIVPGLHLGEIVDGEADGQPHHFANGDDDLFGSEPDDEDGVLLPRLIEIGQTADFQVTAVNQRGVDAYLYAFVDWNGDGDFEDERESQTQTIPSISGVQILTLTFNVPTSTLMSGEGNLNDLGLRFRLSTSTGLTAHDTKGGPIPNGEVEDYLIPAETDVDIVDFSHQLGETGKVTLTWGALGEASNISFRIYRTDSTVFENPRYEGSVTSKWPDTHEDERTNYQFVDYVGESGTYTYWLYSIDVNGHYNWHSSTTETVAGPTHKLFLPIAPQN